MRNCLMVYIFLLGVMWFWTGCATEEVEEHQTMEKKAWTFMLYDDADFDHAFDPWTDFISRMMATEHIHVLVLGYRGRCLETWKLSMRTIFS